MKFVPILTNRRIKASKERTTSPFFVRTGKNERVLHDTQVDYEIITLELLEMLKDWQNALDLVRKKPQKTAYAPFFGSKSVSECNLEAR